MNVYQESSLNLSKKDDYLNPLSLGPFSCLTLLQIHKHNICRSLNDVVKIE